MDTETIERVRTHLMGTADAEDISLDNVIVFGSRVRDDYRDRSDIDILIVSEDFRGVPKAHRSRFLYLNWDYGTLPEPEFICLTPEEFAEKKERKPHIVRTAVETGVSIA